MSETKPQKTFVRGSYLYMQDGEGYQQGHKEGNDSAQQKVIVDKLGIQEYQKELKSRKLEADNKRKGANKANDRPTLIPIRDTPVQPIPQPILTYQKCERATQQQFEYFQFIVNQKEKQKQFEEEQNEQISEFLQRQKKLKEKELESTPGSSVALVMEKEEEEEKPTRRKGLIKIKIIKKEGNQKSPRQSAEKPAHKVRVLDSQE